MAGYQPRHDTDPVWYNGTKINHLDITSTGVGVRITGVHGWDDRPDVRDVREVRPAQDGEYADNAFLGGRTITIEGEVYGSTWANLQTRKRTLAAVFNPTSDEVLFKIPDPATASPTTSYSTTGMTGYERVNARVIEAIQFGDTLDPMCQTFQVVLRASDPRVYSDTETSTDSGTTGTSARTVAVDQGGTYDTPPTLTVTGPTGSAWDIAEPTSGLDLDFAGVALGSGATVAIDVKERTAYLTASYEQVRTSYDSLVALWMLDETSGTTADNQEGTAALDGTYTGGYTLNQSGPKSGVASVDLNGTTGYISLTTNASMDVQESTWEGWIYLDTLASTNKIIIDHMGGANDGYKLMAYYTTQKMLLEIGLGTSFRQFLVDSTLTTGVWTHLAVVTTASSVAVYRDGVRVNLSSAPGGYSDLQPGDEYSPPPASTAMTFGRSSNGASRYLDGRIAGFTFYDTNFDAGTIQALYEATNDTGNVFSVYPQLDAATSRWEDLGTASSTYTLSSTGLNTGSKLNVAYRDARL